MPSTIRVTTTYAFEPHELKKIQGAAADARIEVDICKSGEEFRDKLRDSDVVYGRIGGADLPAAPKLKWVQWNAAGIDNMDPEVRASALTITNMARVFAPGISETAIGMLLALTRGIAMYYVPRFQRRDMSPVGTLKSADHVEIAGRTLGVAGFGGIGEAVARRLHFGFDMRIVATDAKPIPKPEWVDTLREPSWFPEMARQVDVLVAAAPLTPATERMFNEEVFKGMKRTAYFLALSRGELFDDMAVVKALREGWIAGAGLDVFPQEPPPSTHPIFDCPNVVMTAHTSGWSVDRQVRWVDLFVENLRRYAARLPLLNVVDKQAGY